jgi:UDP:flavonoid glycosyltransferase YjiC (YdhE family)
MIALPFASDQPGWTARIKFHSLGTGMDLEAIDIAALSEKIRSVMADPQIRLHLAALKSNQVQQDLSVLERLAAT